MFGMASRPCAHGASRVNDMPWVLRVGTRKVTRWSAPIFFSAECQTAGRPLTAWYSCTEQLSHPVTWRCSVVRATLCAPAPADPVAACASFCAVVAKAAAVSVARTAATPCTRRADVMSVSRLVVRGLPVVPPRPLRRHRTTKGCTGNSPPRGCCRRRRDRLRRGHLREVGQPCRGRRVTRHPPVSARAHRSAGTDLRPVGQRAALELAGEEASAEHLEPVPDPA